ncbi:MAG: hypothetical protein EOO10_13315 [Chitinophagaceae bacterium]|nr:MAG: hypothetical protein EOO10_13315 [Chitinophagaceae bacterium]
MSNLFLSFYATNEQLNSMHRLFYRKYDYCIVTFSDELEKRYAVIDLGNSSKIAESLIDIVAFYSDEVQRMTEGEFRNLLPFESDKQYSMSGSDGCVELLGRFWR